MTRSARQNALSVDARAIVIGAGVALAVALPPLLVYQALRGADVIGDQSPLALLFYGLMMIGFALGGFVAASKRPDTPLTHGALAAFAAFAAVQLAAAAVILARGDTPGIVKIVFNAMLSAGLGVVGGLVATRRPAVNP